MSDDVHYSDKVLPAVPKRFLCGRKRKELPWTGSPDFVDCPQCRAKLREAGRLNNPPKVASTTTNRTA